MAFDFWSGRLSGKNNYERELKDAERKAKEQLAKEMAEMRAMNLNGRPDLGAVTNVSAGAGPGVGDQIGRMQAFDRNRALMNNPTQLLSFLKTGRADVGAGPLRGTLGSVEEDFERSAAGLDRAQAEMDDPYLLEHRKETNATAAATGKRAARKRAPLSGTVKDYFVY